jgi:parvulin-like peptidyl-prolyl isomerase
MRRFVLIFVLSAALPAVAAQVVVDRIVARIENDVITLSDLHELAAFQQLSGRTPAADPELLRQLIGQWIVRNDAAAARFPRPDAHEVDSEFQTLRNHIGSPEVFQAQLGELGLTEKAVRRLVEEQVYLDLYLDRKFRALVRVPPEDIERYYRETLVPELQNSHQQVPELDDVRDGITEVLLLREINRRAEQWVEQTRARLNIEIFKESEQ